MRTDEFDYYLPPELIAQTPAEPRDSSRLLHLGCAAGTIEHHRFHDLPRFLRPGDLLVANDSRVIPARIYGRKSTGGRVEVLLLRPLSPTRWEAIVGGRRIRAGTELTLGEEATIRGVVVEEGERSERTIEFDGPIMPLLCKIGQTPLPPYVRSELHDPERYQTVYSRAEGSTAAPTAGLHFTPELLLGLREMGVGLEFVTLHIGLDTFNPVTEEHVEDHRMHREWCSLSAEVARRVNETRLEGGRVVAVGTTAVRVLESAARSCTPVDAGSSACGWQTVAAHEGETELFITPGFEFRAVDVMVTNFHLPRSTLLMLVSAFAGFKSAGGDGRALIYRAYEEAIRLRYRFYSFGDACLID